MVEQRYNASIGRPMRFLKSVRVSVFKSQVPTLLFARSLLLEILLSHHVQVSVRRQLCPRRRFLSRLFPDCISGALLRRSAVSRALSVERRHAAYDERRCCHHYKKPHRFEFSGHALGRQPCAILAGNRNPADKHSLPAVANISPITLFASPLLAPSSMRSPERNSIGH